MNSSPVRLDKSTNALALCHPQVQSHVLSSLKLAPEILIYQ